MFFVEKLGTYRHGIWFTSTDQDECVDEAIRMANLDRDDYHQWVVFNFLPQTQYHLSDPQHQMIGGVYKGGDFVYQPRDFNDGYLWAKSEHDRDKSLKQIEAIIEKDSVSDKTEFNNGVMQYIKEKREKLSTHG